MESVGFTRKLDEIGRFFIPIKLRRTFGIKIKWKSL